MTAVEGKAKLVETDAADWAVRYVYGYGRTKHIFDETREGRGWRESEPALCGAYGGYPREEPERPVCKRCAKAAEKRGA